MIVSIRGTLRARGPDWVQVEVGGVTFQISVPSSLSLEVGEEGQEVTLHTRLIIRDDEPQLYGFPSPEALRFFHMLTGVSGIGPRSALNLLSARHPEALAAAILTGDLDTFTGVSGIGKKSAARIVLELKGKLEKEGLSTGFTAAPSDADAVSALTGLGYTIVEARRALAALGTDAVGLGLEERVRRALTHLATGR